MANNLADGGAVDDVLIAHYDQRAEAEVALLIVEYSYVLPGQGNQKAVGHLRRRADPRVAQTG
ncbi:MAG: hypothetical protein AB1556_09010 [Bacillota bacterium]